MGGGGGTSFSTDVPAGGGIDAGSLIAAPQSNGFGTMTPGGDIGSSTPFTVMGTLGALSNGLPGVARQFNQFGGQQGLLNANSNRVVTQAPSNAVGRTQTPANLFGGDMSSPNGLDHIWTQAFGPTRPQSSATAALLGHLMKGV